MDRTKIAQKMLVVAWLTSAIIGSGASALADPVWYDFNWYARQELTVAGLGNTAPLADFPLLVKITDGAHPLFDLAQANGQDLFFTDAQGNKLAHEIELYRPAGTKELDAWVRLPSLPAAGTTLYLYYGNPGAAGQENVPGTWDSHYRMVQHLQESGATAGSRRDSTSYGNHGTPYEGTTISDLYTEAGKIGGGAAFDGAWDGTFDSIHFGSQSSLATPENGSIEFWVNGFGAGNHPPNNQEGKISLNYGPLIYGINRIDVYWPGASTEYPGGFLLTRNEWAHVAVAWENAGTGTNNGALYWYKNGVLQRTVSGLLLPKKSAGCEIGKYGGSSPLNGAMDEVRISATARGADWFLASYRNQGDAGYVQLGEMENLPEPGTMALLALGGLGLLAVVRRRHAG